MAEQIDRQISEFVSITLKFVVELIFHSHLHFINSHHIYLNIFASDNFMTSIHRTATSQINWYKRRAHVSWYKRNVDQF